MLTIAALGLITTGGFLAYAHMSNSEEQEKMIIENYSPNANTVLIDVRTPEEYSQGHIPGAINIDVSDPQFLAKVTQAIVGKNAAVYCRTGARSSRAAQLLSQQGIAVSDLGGIVDYRGELER